MGDLLDKSETDNVLNNSSMFSEDDNMYDHNFYDKDDNSDISASIEDDEKDEFETF